MTYKQDAYEQLKSAIASGKIVSGTMYSEQWLADYLGMSRTPVREALLQLASEKMIVTRPNRGLMLRPLDEADIREIVEVRTAVEGYCARLLAKAANTPEGQNTCKKLERIHASSQKKYVDTELFLKLDADFHKTLIAFSGSPMLDKLDDDLRFRFVPFGYLVENVSEQFMRAAEEHRTILDAIESGDSNAAYDSIEHYMAAVGEVLVAQLAEH